MAGQGSDGTMIEQIARAIAGRGNSLNRPDAARLDRLGPSHRARITGDAEAAWEACRLSISTRMKEGAVDLGLFNQPVFFDASLIDALLEWAASGIEARSDETPQEVRPEGQEPGGEAETPTPSRHP